MKKLISRLKISKKVIIISIIIIVVVAGGIFTYSKVSKKADATASNYTASTVQKGDISVTISGSGTVEPISKYDIISLVKGDILSCNLNEGDTVKKGDVLYRVDSADAQNILQKQRNSVEKTQLTAKTNADNIANLKVKATASGTLTDFTLKVNDSAKVEKVATIIDCDSLVATIPFNSGQISKIHIGDSATVISALYMTTIEGEVSYVSSTSAGSLDGSTLYNVEISFANPGSLKSGTSVGATVHTLSGDVKSPASGTIDNGESTSVIPKVSGKIAQIYVKNNQYVNEGDILFQIDGTDYIEAQKRTNLELQDSLLSLESSNKELENYNITSPIDGIVLTKTYKAGDTIGSSQNSSTVLMTVADTTQMIFNLDVDELEIAKVKVGLTASITADALPNTTFSGVVTKVANEGTSANGVTTYKVELTISEPGELMSGMNVNAEIIVEESKDTLLVPVAAVTNLKNNEGYVLVKSDAVKGDSTENQQRQRPQSDASSVQGADGQQGGGKRNYVTPQQSGTARQGGTSAQGWQGQSGNATSNATKSNAVNPTEGYKRIKVTTGLSSTDNIEILSGLNEGDEILIVSATSSAKNTTTQQMGGMGMGMGGPPSGGGTSTRR